MATNAATLREQGFGETQRRDTVVGAAAGDGGGVRRVHYLCDVSRIS